MALKQNSRRSGENERVDWIISKVFCLSTFCVVQQTSSLLSTRLTRFGLHRTRLMRGPDQVHLGMLIVELVITVICFWIIQTLRVLIK